MRQTAIYNSRLRSERIGAFFADLHRVLSAWRSVTGGPLSNGDLLTAVKVAVERGVIDSATSKIVQLSGFSIHSISDAT